MNICLRATVFITIFSLLACARPTVDIEPVPIDPRIYFGRACSELVEERARRTQALIFVGLIQDQISEDDRTRTLGIPTPMGSEFNESKADQVARLKGEVRAIGSALASLNCGPDYR